MSLGVGLGEPAVLGQDDCLNHIELLRGPALKVALSLFSAGPMKELPRRIAHGEERLAELIEQEMAIFTGLGGIGCHPR
jgi:hypothetical protein